jgi:hypothetical protein
VEEIKKMILVLGSKGMLGQELIKVFGSEAVGWDREECDATKILDFRLQIADLKPSSIINCVAYNNVDGAETNESAAYLLNEKVPADSFVSAPSTLLYATQLIMDDGFKSAICNLKSKIFVASHSSLSHPTASLPKTFISS